MRTGNRAAVGGVNGALEHRGSLCEAAEKAADLQPLDVTQLDRYGRLINEWRARSDFATAVEREQFAAAERMFLELVRLL